MKIEATVLLHKAVREKLHRSVLGLGFIPEHRRGDCYPYRRVRGEFNDLLEVNFDKGGKPCFVVCFGVCHEVGIVDAYGRQLKSGEVRISHLVEHGCLYSSKLFIRWFCVRSLGAFSGKEKAADNVVEKCIALLSQVDAWFREGGVGDNIKMYRNSENLPNVRRDSMIRRGVWPPPDWTEEDELKSK